MRTEIKVYFGALTEKNTAKIVFLLWLFKAQSVSEIFEPFYLKSKFYKKRGATFLMTSHISSVMGFLTTSLHKNCQNDVKLLET